MKTIKKTVEVPACDLCGKELVKNDMYVMDEPTEKIKTFFKEYHFHKECAYKVLLENLKK